VTQSIKSLSKIKLRLVLIESIMRVRRPRRLRWKQCGEHKSAESDRPGFHCQVPPNPATATTALLSFAVSPRRGVTGRRLS
jgi:hypothetical protein